jgi:hypothetical protein
MAVYQLFLANLDGLLLGLLLDLLLGLYGFIWVYHHSFWPAGNHVCALLVADFLGPLAD